MLTIQGGTVTMWEDENERNLTRHRFAMADWKCQSLQVQEVMIFTKSKLQGMTWEVFTFEEEVHSHPFKF